MRKTITLTRIDSGFDNLPPMYLIGDRYDGYDAQAHPAIEYRLPRGYTLGTDYTGDPVLVDFWSIPCTIVDGGRPGAWIGPTIDGRVRLELETDAYERDHQNMMRGVLSALRENRAGTLSNEGGVDYIIMAQRNVCAHIGIPPAKAEAIVGAVHGSPVSLFVIEMPLDVQEVCPSCEFAVDYPEQVRCRACGARLGAES